MKNSLNKSEQIKTYLSHKQILIVLIEVLKFQQSV